MADVEQRADCPRLQLYTNSGATSNTRSEEPP